MDKINVTTYYDKDTMLQELAYLDDDTRKVFMRSIVDLREEQVRQALINLGWTPPEQTRK